MNVDVATGEMGEGMTHLPEKAYTKSRTTISLNQHALIVLPSEGMKIIFLKPDGIISLGKFGSFRVNSIIGFPFGTSFEIIEDLNVRRIKSISSDTEDANFSNDNDEITADDLTSAFSQSSESNQNIINIGSKIQKLSAAEVEDLKKAGATGDVGQKIIQKMIAGHEGFDKKTVYSQLKYLKRKQQKFHRRFRIEYLGSSQLLQYYAEKNPRKVLDLSEESLGLILNYANVRKGGKYLLADETGGLLLYAILERIGEEGLVVSIHENEHPNHIELRYSDYTEDYKSKVIKSINWLQFLEPENEKISWLDEPEEVVNEMRINKREQYNRRKSKAKSINDVIDLVLQGNFDGFISVSTLYMPTLLPHIVPKIGGSRPIVVYDQFKEPLVELQHSLENDKRVLAPTILESKVRPYQTISGRLHPIMSMRGYGGYIMWGTRVFPKDSGITAVGRGMSKSRTKE